MTQFIIAVVFVAMAAIGIDGQTAAADYSGKWTLDTGASKMDERSRIEAMTMSVEQKDGKMTVATETKRSAPTGGQGGMGRGGGMRGAGLGDGTYVYSLDGKETTAEMATQMGAVPMKLKARDENGQMKLSVTRTINSPMGEVSLTTNETWKLSDDGKTLTVERSIQTPRGSNNSTLVFRK